MRFFGASSFNFRMATCVALGKGEMSINACVILVIYEHCEPHENASHQAMILMDDERNYYYCY